MNRNTIGVLIALVVVVGGWYLLRGNPASAPAVENSTADVTTTTATTSAAVPSDVIIAYTDQGFSPQSVSITEGQTVTWVNQSSKSMWVASAVHPDHTVYDGTSKNTHCAAGYTGPIPFDECSAGASYRFTFDKAGTWKYHNHADASKFGSVTVTAAAQN